MYKKICEINESTHYAVKDNTIYVLKRINANDIDTYKKIIEINNPNIARHYEFTSIDDALYVVVEYISGITLKQYCEENHPLPNDTILKITNGICNGLNEIHRANLVHRDITPTNIMIDANGNPVIIDFGISRINKPDSTMDTQLLGTHGFAAPEQYGFSQTSQRADIYSLGVLINYMSTLALPNVQMAGGRFEHIVRKCIEMDTTKRYANISELSNALNHHSIESIVRSTPGFRQGKGWHIIVATIYYILLIPIFYALYDSIKTPLGKFCNIMIGLFSLVFTVPIVTDYNEWLEKWSFTKKLSKGGKIAIQASFVLICIIISIIFILLSQK